MTDGYKYIDVFYHLQTLPNFKVELNVDSIVGNVMFSTLFYSDENYTSFIGETTNQEVIIGENVFQTDSLQSGNMTLYAIGRIKLLQGSNLSISSIKLNETSHIVSGYLFVDIPPLNFDFYNEKFSVYHSVKLGLIEDQNFQIELQVQQMTGAIGVEYLYYSDEDYSILSSVQTIPLVLNNNIFQVERVNKYVILRFKMPYGGNLVMDSFKLQQIEQGSFTLSTLEYIPEISVISETCFPANTMVKTDQGSIAIQNIKPYHHTIQGNIVVAITSTYSSEKEMVLIKKDSIRKNYPIYDTLISRKHKIYMKGKMKAAYRLKDIYKGVSLVPYEGQMLFNVVLEEYGLMNIQGMICETLHPMNPMAIFFRELYNPEKKDYTNLNKIESHKYFLVQ